MQKSKNRKCETPYCKNKSAPNRRRCHKCNKRNYRAANPEKSSYQTNKDNSKRRGIFFGITFEEFKKLAKKTKYIAGKGRSKDSLTLDRIIEGPRPGYIVSNIQVISRSDNSKKEIERRRVLHYDFETKYAKVI